MHDGGVRNVVVIGAGGNMVAVTIKSILEVDDDVRFVLTDRDEGRLKQLVEELEHHGGISAQVIDLYDSAALDAVVGQADLVVNGAGPYYKTAAPVLESCLRQGANYLDLDDDIESTIEALSFDERARAAGVSVLIGCGVSPGLTNVVGREMIEQLDTVDSLDMAGVLGATVDDDVGPAVIDHLVHILTTSFGAWHDGRRTEIPSYTESAVLPFAQPLGDFRVYEAAHPEPATFPRTYPEVRTVRMYLGVEPQAYNGLMQGVGAAYRTGRMTLDDVVAFFREVYSGKTGTAKGWRAAVRGMAGQVWRRENTGRDAVAAVLNGVRGKTQPFAVQFLWVARGTRDGDHVHLVRRLVGTPGSSLDGMASVTGRAAAAFVRLAIDKPPPTPGVFAPEAWAAPTDFAAALLRYGYPEGALSRVEVLGAR